MGIGKKIFLAGGFFFTGIVGTLLHFVYEWSGYHFLAGLVAPVSESAWEHLKMLFFPALVWMSGGRILLQKSAAGIVAACTAGICTGMLAVVTFFYTYTGILGKNWLPLDIFAFYLGVFATFFVAGKSWNKFPDGGWQDKLAIAVLIALALCFFLFSYRIPPIGLFQIPSCYGAAFPAP